MKPCSAWATTNAQRASAAPTREIAPVHSAEARVEAAPARHAVDVHRDLGRRQVLELLPRQPDRVLDVAPDAEVPGREVDLRDRSRMQDGPLLRQVLTGREACRSYPASATFFSALERNTRLRLVRNAHRGTAAGLRRRARAGCRGFPPADALERRHRGAVRRAAADAEGADHRADARDAPRGRRLPASHRTWARRDRAVGAATSPVRGQVRDRAGGAHFRARLGRRLCSRREQLDAGASRP